MKIICPFCKEEIEKSDRDIQRCPLCGFFFETKKQNKKRFRRLTDKGEVGAEIVFIDESTSIDGSEIHLTFCFTGKLNLMTRNYAIEHLKGKGHAYKSSVSRNVDYLVTNYPNSNTGKMKRALEIGIPIISENKFLELVRQI